jgi:hypothetical protein
MVNTDTRILPEHSDRIVPFQFALIDDSEAKSVAESPAGCELERFVYRPRAYQIDPGDL